MMMIKVPLSCGEKLQISSTQEKALCVNVEIWYKLSEQYLQLYLRLKSLIYCLLSCATRWTWSNNLSFPHAALRC